jgi:hypothetical protein
MPKIYCLFSAGSFFEREESLPLDKGLTVGSSSTFFKEFLRIREGLFSFLLASP